MGNNFTKIGFEKTFNVEALMTIFYMEFSMDSAIRASSTISGKWFI